MFVSIRYVGAFKRRISWTSMGQCYSYNVVPGETIDVPISQVNNAKGCAPFEDGLKKNRKHKVRKVRKLFEKESTEVVTKEDENLFIKQDKLGLVSDEDEDEEVLPSVVIEMDDDPEPTTEEIIAVVQNVIEEETEDVEIEVEEEEVSEEGSVEEGNDTDFVALTKAELADYIIANDKANESSKTALLRERKDTLIAKCVQLESSM